MTSTSDPAELRRRACDGDHIATPEIQAYPRHRRSLVNLTVDTEGIRAAARRLGDAETSFRGGVCAAPTLGDDALGSDALGREASDLLLRRARQAQEALDTLTVVAGALVDRLVRSADALDRIEAALAAVGGG